MAAPGWVDAALCGQCGEALNALVAGPVDALVMEPHLRVGDVSTVALAARRSVFGDPPDAPTPRPLIISLSASGRISDQSDCGPSLYDFVVIKTVPMEQLTALLASRRSRLQRS